MNKHYILFFFLFNCTFAFSQLSFCSGSKGEPIFFEDFGTGFNYGPALIAGVTNYSYVNSGFPQDGQYTLYNRTNLIPNNWLYSLDHTPDNQPNGLDGKCLIVNASNTPGQFYKKTVTNLCSNTTFEFSAWLINIYNAAAGACPGTGIPINITFEIWNSTDTILLQSGNTGNIDGTSNPIWNQFGLVFTMGAGQTSVILKIRNNGAGGCGNDLAIDDIMFRACGEFSQISNGGNTQNSISICQNETITNNVLTITTSGTASNVYQWQQSSDAINYVDIAGETNTTYSIPSVAATTYYRVKVANDISNLGNPFCSTLSEIFTVNVNPFPNPPVSNGDKTLCSNQPTALTVTVATNESVNWYNAAVNGNLIQSNSTSITPTVAGTYYAETYNLLTGCKNSNRTAVQLLPMTTVSYSGITTICSTEILSLTLTPSDLNATIGWTATSTNVTGFSNGNGNQIQQTLTNVGNSAGTVIYNVTPVVSGCAGMAQSITVFVNTQATITPTFNTIPLTYCLNATPPILPNSSTNSPPIIGTWSPPTINTSTTGNATYTFIPQASSCSNFTPYSVTITVVNNFIPNFTSPIIICSGANPPALNSISPNGISGTWSPPIINNQIPASYLFTPNPNQCAVAQTINVVVNSSTTTFTTSGVTSVCSSETTAITLTPSDLNANISWTATSTDVTGFSNGTGNSIQQTLSTIGNTVGTVIYNIKPTLNNCDGIIQTVTVTVNPQSNITPTFGIIPTNFCLNEIPPVLPNSSTNATPAIGTWNPPIIETSTIGTATYTFIPQVNGCIIYAPYSLTITIINGFKPDFDDPISFCIGKTPPILNTTSPVGITGTWNPAVIDNQVDGSYLFTPNPNQCANPQTINVTVLKPTLTNIDLTTSLYFSDNQIITVAATDVGNYLYQLDNGSFQTDNVFSNVTSGTHKITVMDETNCSPSLSESILVVNYPTFFTPNGDGINDVWTIKGLNILKNMEISIFDRYGKLIKQIVPYGIGWDGTFDGNALPAADYWFVIQFEENNTAKTFRSHFSLSR
jgi:gliding motility-associated-like protein